MRSKKYPPRATFESAWALVQENAQSLKIMEKENKRERKERKESMKAMKEKEEMERKERKESMKAMKEKEEMERKEWKESMKAMKEKEEMERKEWKESMKAMKAESEKEWEEFRASMKAMQKELGGISKSNGEVAESYFQNSFRESMQFAGQKFYGISPNLRKADDRLNLKGEYDLVLYNCTSVVIIEIKYKSREKDVKELLEKMPTFKQLYPEYATYNLYLGIAALHVTSAAEKACIEQGIAVIKQVGESMVIVDTHLKVF